jgi:hypothetical protein
MGLHAVGNTRAYERPPFEGVYEWLEVQPAQIEALRGSGGDATGDR